MTLPIISKNTYDMCFLYKVYDPPLRCKFSYKICNPPQSLVLGITQKHEMKPFRIKFMTPQLFVPKTSKIMPWLCHAFHLFKTLCGPSANSTLIRPTKRFHGTKVPWLARPGAQYNAMNFRAPGGSGMVNLRYHRRPF